MIVPSRRYLSLWLARLPTDRLVRRLPAPDDVPLATVALVKSTLRLCALNDAAAARGLKRSMPLADARAMHPDIRVEPADPQADRELLEALADWCDRYTPLVGLDPPDGLLLDVTGCAHLFGGEKELARDLIARFAQQGLQAHVGLASTVGCAWAVARFGKTALVPEQATHDSVLPRPLAALRLDGETVDALAQSGLKYVAEVLARSRASMAARFGQDMLRKLDLALGHAEEPITPRLPLPSYVTERRFPEPIALQADVLGTIAQLAQELGQVLERHGEGARRLQAALFRADGKVYRVEAGAGAPLRDGERIRRLFVERLDAVGDECDPGFGYDVIRLSALATERFDPAQTGFGGHDHDTELADLVDRLSARYGARRLMRLVPRDTHIPEFAVAAMPAQYLRGSCAAEALLQDSLAPLRPLRLFERPELIEAVAEVPDGPPVRFRWRRVLHEIAVSEGPERIAMEWWRDDQGRALTRDYFRLESRSGMRVWVYREGLYGRETQEPRWFLHGLFA
ncbi:MAG: DNA polymerase Y family protein [Pseudolabrys sp.]